MAETFIIAEAGVNHNGSLDLAFGLVDAAVKAGADAVKFQTFKTELLVTQNAEQSEYQTRNIGEKTTQFEMLKKLELDFEGFKKLKEYCEHKNIVFMSTPFDLDSLDFLVNELKVKTIKISSGEITNAPMLYKIAKSNTDIILSTGMAVIQEIHHSLAFLAYGYSGQSDISIENALNYYKTSDAKKLLKEKVRILHCTSEYPTPIENVNLRAMDFLQEETGLEIGLSDHTEGILIPIAAVAKGAKVIEKHFTLNKNLPGPDHKASLEPDELMEMIQSIRIVEKSLGNYGKTPNESEKKTKEVARKSIIISKEVKKGEVFSEENLTVKRPGNGISPIYYWDYIGKMAEKDYVEDELLNQ